MWDHHRLFPFLLSFLLLNPVHTLNSFHSGQRGLPRCNVPFRVLKLQFGSRCHWETLWKPAWGVLPVSFWLSLSEYVPYLCSSLPSSCAFHSYPLFFFYFCIVVVVIIIRCFRLAFGVKQTWARVPVYYLRWILEHLFDLSTPQFPYQKNGDNNSAHLPGLWWGLTGTVHVKCPAWCLQRVSGLLIVVIIIIIAVIIMSLVWHSPP